MSQRKKNNAGREDKDKDLGTTSIIAPPPSPPAEEAVADPVVEAVADPVAEAVADAIVVVVVEVPEELPHFPNKVVPKVVVVVPHRNRAASLNMFREHMIANVFRPEVESGEYRFVFVEQGDDQRFFNRGAIKNIGFLFVRSEYPDDYQNITLTFNDIDTMPAERGLMDYETSPGVVKHFYGVKWTLGGIVSVRGADFESINGFPNYWHWGYEDNMLKRRVTDSGGITIDYSQFFGMNDARVIHHSNFKLKVVNIEEHKRFLANDPEGFAQISNLTYDITTTTTTTTWTGTDVAVLVSHFDTPFTQGVDTSSVFDMTEARTPFSSQPNGTVVRTQPNRRSTGMIGGIGGVGGVGGGGRRKAAMAMQLH